MSLKNKVSISVSLIDTILKATTVLIQNEKTAQIPNLKLVLLTFKAKFDSFNQDSRLSSINEKITEPYIDKLNTYLELLANDSEFWKTSFQEIHEDNIAIMTSRLLTMSELFESVISFPEDDLLSLDQSHERWKNLQSSVVVHHLNKTDLVLKKHQKFFNKIASSLAYINKNGPKAPTNKNLMLIGLGSLYYMTRKQKALRKAHLFHSTPNLNTARYMLELLETKLVRKLSKILMKGVKYDKVLYIPRTVSNVLDEFSMNLVSPKLRNSLTDQEVMTRLLSSHKFPLKSPQKTLIIHIHGGGFICMSSASHQVYTNIWAQELKVPIFSVDYRLAPDNPFPAALDDVWQVFNWLFHYGQCELGVSPENYIIVGDSAGGNLALALTYKIIKSGLRPPSGVILAYPALKLARSYSPSMIYALEDLLVPHTFLQVCLDAYLGEYSNAKDPLISPFYIEKEVLEVLPPVRILVGTNDPFHDECWRFTEKLNDAGRDVKLAVFSGSSHGGLNYCFKGGIKETRDMVDLVSVWMREILNKYE